MCSKKRVDQWNLTAPEQEFNLRRGMQKTNWRALINVVPTSTKLKIPNREYTAALRAQLGAPEPPRNGNCVCNKQQGREHAFGCTRGAVHQTAHRALRDELSNCAKACGLDPDIGEPRNQPHSNNNAGGADIKVNYTPAERLTVAGVPVTEANERSALIIDVTLPAATVKANVKTLMQEGAGAVAKAHEKAKRVNTPDAAVAHLNGQEYIGAALELDTLHVGDGLATVTRRFARQRNNREFDYDLDRQWGYKLGMWSTPTAARYWTAAIIIAVVVARERAIYDLYALGHRELGDL